MKKNTLTPFGEAVQKRLIQIGKTQAKLAMELKVGASYLNRILHGKRSGEKYIGSIARLLDIDLLELEAS